MRQRKTPGNEKMSRGRRHFTPLVAVAMRLTSDLPTNDRGSAARWRELVCSSQ
jgi:hypothetical protein